MRAVGWSEAHVLSVLTCDVSWGMRTPAFDMRVLGADGRHRVVLSGELDVAASAELVGGVQDLIAARSEELEIDLRKVVFIDSTGLRALLVAKDEAERTAIPLYVIPSASEPVRAIFEVTNLHDALPWRLPISSSQRAAIENLEQAFRADDDAEPETSSPGSFG
jgi:anti-anti-sigma factor